MRHILNGYQGDEILTAIIISGCICLAGVIAAILTATIRQLDRWPFFALFAAGIAAGIWLVYPAFRRKEDD